MTEFLVGDKVQVALPQGYSKRGVKGISVLFTTSMEARFEGAVGVMTQINPRGPHTVHQYLVDFRKYDNGKLGLPWQAQWFREEWLSLLERTPDDPAVVGAERSDAPVQTSTAQAEHSAATGSKSGWATDAEKTTDQQDEEGAKLAASDPHDATSAPTLADGPSGSDADAAPRADGPLGTDAVEPKSSPERAPEVRRASIAPPTGDDSAPEQAVTATEPMTPLGEARQAPPLSVELSGAESADPVSAPQPGGDGREAGAPDDSHASRQIAEDAAASAMLARAARRREASGSGPIDAASSTPAASTPADSTSVEPIAVTTGGPAVERADTLEDLAALERAEAMRTSDGGGQSTATETQDRASTTAERTPEVASEAPVVARSAFGASSPGAVPPQIDAASANDEADWDESPSKPAAQAGTGGTGAEKQAAGASVADLLRRTEPEWNDSEPSNDVSSADDAVSVPVAAGPAAGQAVSPSQTSRKMESGPGWMKGDFGGDCPEAYPIKGNATSRIFHLPGQSSYDKTIPEICFATDADAVAAGYRPRMEGRGAAAKREPKKPRH